VYINNGKKRSINKWESVDKDMELRPTKYLQPGLDVDVYYDVIPPALAKQCYDYFSALTGKDTKTRSSVLFGDEGVVYTVNYKETIHNTQVVPWSYSSLLVTIKGLVEQVTQHHFTVCSVQHYPNGNVGIGPHRDREMVQGTAIIGLSLGATRSIIFSREGYPPIHTLYPPCHIYDSGGRNRSLVLSSYLLY